MPYAPKTATQDKTRQSVYIPFAGVRVVPTHLRRGVGGGAAATAAATVAPHAAEPPGTPVKRSHGHVVRLLHRLVHVARAAVVAAVVLAVGGVPQRAVVVPAGRLSWRHSWQAFRVQEGLIMVIHAS